MVTIFDLSRKIQAGKDSTTVTRTMRVVPYAACFDVATSLLGYVRLVGRRLVRIPPARDPWLPWCFCESVDIEGFGAYVGSPAVGDLALRSRNIYADGAVLTATYKTPTGQDPEKKQDSQGENTDEQQEVDLATLTWDFNAQQLTLPNERFGWQTEAGRPPDALLLSTETSVTKTLPKVDIVLTRHLCLRKPFRSIIDLLGRINKSPFNVELDTYPAETLRFDGANISRKITSQGLKFHEVAYKFAAQTTWDKIVDTDPNKKDYVGWNRLFKPDVAKWARVVSVADPNRGIYLLDEDTPDYIYNDRSGQRFISGFKKLFHPLAY